MSKVVIKRNGDYQPFKHQKIVRTAMRAGLAKTDAEKVATKVGNSFKDKIHAKLLYDRVLKTMQSVSKTACCRYQLKEAVAKIDPEYFEIYIQRVLKTNGYDSVWNRIIEGATIEHQVDVLASKENVTYFVECKHHISAKRDTGLGKVLQVWARLLDLQDGYKKKKNPYKNAAAWMVTNTKFSMHARKFATAKEIRISGWGTGTYSLQNLIEKKKCYPLQILKLPPKVMQRCEQADLLTIVDVLEDQKKAKAIFGSQYFQILDSISTLMTIKQK